MRCVAAGTGRHPGAGRGAQVWLPWTGPMGTAVAGGPGAGGADGAGGPDGCAGGQGRVPWPPVWERTC